MTEPKVLFFDIETAPLLIYAWGVHEQDAIDIKRDWFMLSFAYKWQGEKRITTRALPDYAAYRKDKNNDRPLVEELWGLFNAADVIVAHNGDRFDIRKATARFVFHKMLPPAPYKKIDTLKMARRVCAFSSNRLNSLAKHLGIGQKLPHTGWNLWDRCMSGDPKAWKLMRRYNAHDVDLLEKVYLRLRAWDPSHPNLVALSGKRGCPACQSQQVQRRGYNVARTRRTPRFHCQECGHWYSDGKAA